MKKKKSSKVSLRQRLNNLLIICLIPQAIITLCLVFMVGHFSDSYDEVVGDIAIINKYNIEFKNEIDYVMYVIVANSERADELVNVEIPHQMIRDAKEDFSELAEAAKSDTARKHALDIIKSLVTLELQIDEIETSSKIAGNYDLNMERLDLNIRVMTELIQDQIQEYIYFETMYLETVQKNTRMEAMQTEGIFVASLITIILLALLISQRIVSGITEPIEELCNAARMAGQGDFTVRTAYETDDELEELNKTFNQMVERIGTLVEDVRVEQMNLRNAELKLLQEQINPHFLYNTLDAIIWLAEAGEKEMVVRMVTSLSVFFRTTLAKGKDYVPVSSEEQHVRSYLEIQQFRYRDILDYDIDISEEIYNYEVQKLTLQPLVENAIYHGIKNKRGKGCIKVFGEKRNKDLIFKVWDNGMGMEEERLAQVQNLIDGNLRELPGTSSGFGLFNVNRRIILNYGYQYGITIKSVYKEWTEVTVRLPAVTSDSASEGQVLH